MKSNVTAQCLTIKVHSLVFLFALLHLFHSDLHAQTWKQVLKQSGEMDKPSSAGRNSGENFGRSLAISNDIVVVGAPNDAESATGSGSVSNAGAVFVFKRSGSEWILIQKLVASDRSADDNFGYTVDIDNNVIVVGAYREDQDANGLNTVDASGSVYVFTYNGTKWVQSQKLVAKDRGINDQFGSALAIENNTIVVGAYLEDNDTAGGDARLNGGSAYIFEKINSSWLQTQKIIANDRFAGDNFGYCVDISNHTIFIGAYNEDEDQNAQNNLSDAGSVYAFEMSGAWWTQVQKIVAPDRATLDNFGNALNAHGNLLIVGAFNEDHDAGGLNTKGQAGSAYIFKKISGSWTFAQKIVASDRNTSDNFGYALAIGTNYAVVGAYNEDQDILGNNTLANAGSLYTFKLNGTTWTQSQKIVAIDRGASDNYGAAIALDSTYFVSGAMNEDEDTSGINTQGNSGSAYIYKLNTNTWYHNTKIVAYDRAKYDYYGQSVYMNGQFAAVGAVHETEDANGKASQFEAGAVYIYQLQSNKWQFFQKITPSDRGYMSHFGSSVHIDGNSMIIGANGDFKDSAGKGNLVAAGSAYIFTLVNNVWVQDYKLLAKDREAGDNFGISVSMSGNYAIVGADSEDHDSAGLNFKDYAGSAYIFKKNGNTWSQDKKIVAKHRETYSRYGQSVAMDGNYAVVGSFQEDSGEFGNPAVSNAGAAYIYKLSSGNWNLDRKITASDRAKDDIFGLSLSISGNYIVVGANGEDEDASGSNTVNSAGSAYVFKLSSGTWTQMQKIVAYDRMNNARFGFSVNILDTMIIAGAIGNNNFNSGNIIYNSGAAYVFKLKNNIWQNHGKMTSKDISNGDYFGFNVGIAGSYALSGSIYEENGVNGDDFLENSGSAYFMNDIGNLSYMTVNGKNKGIQYGDNSPDVSDNTDFTKVKLSKSKTFTYKIYANGSDTLRINKIKLKGADSLDFSVQNLNYPLKIKTGDSFAVQISFIPKQIGLRKSTLQISSNDADHSSFTFDVQGLGITADIKVSGNNLQILNGDNSPSIADLTDFGKLKKDKNNKHFFAINNFGSDTLKISTVQIFGPDSLNFKLGPLLQLKTILPGDSTIFEITYNSGAIRKVHEAVIRIISNVTSLSPYTFRVRGESVAALLQVEGNHISILNGDNSPAITDHTDFGTTVRGIDLNRVFTVRNIGTDTLRLSGLNITGINKLQFHANLASTILLPNDSTYLSMGMDSDSLGIKFAKVSFNSNDSSQLAFNFTVRGIIDPKSYIDAKFLSNCKIYPIPSDAALTIDLGETLTSGQIMVYNFAGVIISSISVRDNSIIVLDTRDLCPGTYYIRIITEDLSAMRVFNVLR